MTVSLDKYLDKLIAEISDVIGGQKNNAAQEKKEDLAFRLAMTLVFRLITVRVLQENNQLAVDDGTAKQIILGVQDAADCSLLKLLPVKPVLKQSAVIDLMYRQLKEEVLTPVLDQVTGELYQSGQNKQVRSSLGQYFTEKKYVDLILERIPLTENSRVLEPAVGGGSFLTAVCKQMADNSADPNNRELAAKINRSIVGLDLDQFCVNLSALNMHLQQKATELMPLNLYNADFLTCQFTEKFDVIIGNPPYNARLEPKVRELMKRQYPEITEAGTLNSAALFLRKAVDLLKAGGWLGFVIPNSLLRVTAYKKLRRFILQRCAVKSIINIGKAFKDAGLEMVIIILQKKTADDPQTVEIISEITDGKMSAHQMPYKYLSRWDIFPIYINQSLGEIAAGIEENTLPLEELCTMPRGRGLSAKSRLFYNNPFEVSGDKIPVLRGQDIGQFIIHPAELYITAEQQQTLFTGKSAWYNSRKILVQNVAKRVVAAYDAVGRCVLDTLNMLMLRPQYQRQFSEYYLLALLNSELINFYFQNTINNRSKLTIHMDRPYLGRIPVKISADQHVCSKKAELLVNLGQQLSQYHPLKLLEEDFASSKQLKQKIDVYVTERKKIKEQIKKETAELNDLIYQLYEINEHQKQEIKANLGTNPIREFSFITQLKSLAKKYHHEIGAEKAALIV